MTDSQERREQGDMLRAAATDYATRGWPVFPVHPAENGKCLCGKAVCERPAKHPRTRRGLKDASVEQRKIDSWWRRSPQANVGVRTGKASGLVVLDIDPRHGGNESLDALIAEYGDLPKTVEAETGGGGRHLVFRHPGGEFRNRTNIRPGIDVHGDGGYIVAPPSTHISGQRYAWKSGHAHDDLDPAPFPSWLVDLLASVSSTDERRGETSAARHFDQNAFLIEAAARYIAKSGGAAEGQRNNTAFNLAGHMAAFQTEDGLRLEKGQIVDLLREWNQQNQPPLLDVELVRTISSALRNGTPREPHIVKTKTAAVPLCSPMGTSNFDDLPVAVLPGGSQRVVDSAKRFGELLAATERHFLRGGAVVKLVQEKDGARRLQLLKPASMPAAFEQVARLVKVAIKDGEPEFVATTCNEQTAKILLHSEPFQQALPAIRVVARCPVLIERNGKLLQVTDYDRESGILAEGEPAPDVPLIDARDLLCNLLTDFRFASEGDRSRALAAMITPGLVLGGLLKGRAALDLGEADQSQAGKGYRNRIIAAIYRETIKTVTQRRGGVGSLEETFNAALISAAPFISLDNIRGKIDSPAIESFLTEDRYLARIPYAPTAEIDPRRTIVMVTSNKAEVTPDLANRSSCVRLLKQPPGYTFQQFREGDVLDHVKANQPLYLGTVFAVIKAWYCEGKPSTKEGRHDFRRWARVLDWIVQNLLSAAPIMEGHRQTQQRMTNPALTWLREVALTVERSGKTGQWLRAHHLLNLLEDGGLEIPGVGDDDDLEDEATREKALRSLGKRLATCFGPAGCKLEIDHLVVERRETVDHAGRDRKEYLFRAAYAADQPTDVPTFPHSPRDTSTFHAPELGRAGNGGEESNSPETRGECGGLREDGAGVHKTLRLIDQPKGLGIRIECPGDRLRLRPAGALSPELPEHLKNHKRELLVLMRNQSSQTAVVANCARCEWRFWVDEPPKDGRIRTTCGKCGRFIGYRSENLA